MRDSRPKRVTKPNKWWILAGILCTPWCFAIPIAGWSAVIIGWIWTIRQYFKAVSDEQLPFGHFYGENVSAPEGADQAPKGLSIFKD